MDKAQTTILFIIATVAISFGQYLYERIKKNSAHKTSTPRRDAFSAFFSQQDAPKPPKKRVSTPMPVDQPVAQPAVTNDECSQTDSDNEATVAQATPPQLTDLQKMIVWGEILQRKF